MNSCPPAPPHGAEPLKAQIAGLKSLGFSTVLTTRYIHIYIIIQMKCHGNFCPVVSIFFLFLPVSQNSSLGKGNLSVTVGAKQSCRGGM